ncbi:hypothetical protein CGLO_16805 [Colletotrichum gloeosporioides Cg-14]|uniref:Uncharacterized protein n=1 Tax=Colletotrichum gloeosporioides (strain Cg-14) TaxID=1237896 RepID=T0L8H9_COLGC|nr:hypothetical protein CGLO_16805 [Colletotrichum gloeosporioides Cg-14]
MPEVKQPRLPKHTPQVLYLGMHWSNRSEDRSKGRIQK